MTNAFREHRKVKVDSVGTKSISIPKLILRDLEKSYDLEITYFHIQFKNGILVASSGCVPSGGIINAE